MESFSEMLKLIAATGNTHKVKEIQDILGYEFIVASMPEDLKKVEIVENAPDFSGNAAKKALTVAQLIFKGGCMESELFGVVADDSGLEVDALNGAPGVHSARFALIGAGDSSHRSRSEIDKANNEKLLALLTDVPWEKRTARFRCVLALVTRDAPSGPPHFFEGTCEGRIQFAPSGDGGFGYDPLFVPEGFEQSFAELGHEVKNRISHRARALEKLRNWLQSVAASR